MRRNLLERKRPQSKPGDRIIVNRLPADNTCPICLSGHPFLCERLGKTTFQGRLPDGTTRVYTADGTVLKHLLGSATMAEHTVINRAGAVPVPVDVPFPVAAILGCAAVTGAHHKCCPLAIIQQAFQDMEAGTVACSVIVFD